MFCETEYHHYIFNSYRTKKFAKYFDTASFDKVVTTYFHKIHGIRRAQYGKHQMDGLSASCAGCDQGQGTHPPA